MWFNYLLLGFVQGVAEFLPISSSAHLILFHKYLSIPQDLSLDVSLHFATLLAIIIFYKKFILNVIRSFINDFKNYKQELKKYSFNSRYVLYVFVASVPAGIAGVLFKDFFEEKRTPYVIAFMLVLISLYMSLDYFGNKTKKTNVDVKRAFLVGISQILALIPGTSRSGVTITTASLLGIPKNISAQFSFLMSVPLILGAFLLELKDITNPAGFFTFNTLVAFITAFIVGYFSLKLLIQILQKKGFLPFIIYRVFLAIGIIVFLVL